MFQLWIPRSFCQIVQGSSEWVRLQLRSRWLWAVYPCNIQRADASGAPNTDSSPTQCCILIEAIVASSRGAATYKRESGQCGCVGGRRQTSQEIEICIYRAWGEGGDGHE